MNWSASRETGSGKRPLLLRVLRGTLALLGTVSPPLAARLARRLFLTPPPRRRSGSRAESDCLRAGQGRVVPGLPGLLVHDEQDRLVPYEESARVILRAAPWLEHLATQALGHRGLLAAPVVIASVCEFLLRPAAGQRSRGAVLLEATA